MAVEATEVRTSTTLTIGLLGNRLRYEILEKLIERPGHAEQLARELQAEERLVLRSIAFLVQAELVRLVARQANPRRGGRRYMYRAVPNVQKVPGGKLRLSHKGEAHRFASVLGERVRV